MSTPARRERPGPDGIGRVLQTARAERGVSLAELQTRTKVRVRYLAALEEERFDDLPPRPFARGFLRLMAEELGLDPEPLIRRLDAAMSAGPEVPAESLRHLDAAVTPALPPSRLRRLIVIGLVVIVLVGGSLVVYLNQQVQEFRRSAPAGAPEGTTAAEPPAAPAGAEPEGAAPGPQPPASPGEPAQASPPVTPAEVAADGVMLEIQASGRSWLRIVVDEQAVFEGFVVAGQTRQWQGRGTIVLRAGNAGAVQVTVNGRSLGVLGRPGEVVDRTFDRKDLD